MWTIHDTWILAGDPVTVDQPEYLFPLPHVKNRSLNWEAKKEAIKNSDITFVVASKHMEQAMSRHPVLKDKKMVYVPFGMNFDTFYPRNNAKTREELGFKETETLVLFRGDDPTTKGLQYVSHVMKTLGKKYKIHFLVVGSDGTDIPKGVKATHYGWIKDDEMMAKLHSVADLLLMPSTRESFGMMAVEAMACGTLPIVIEGTALPETVHAPTHGVSTPRDMEKYTHTVEYFIKNTKERARREKKCIQYVKQKHDMEKYLSSMDSLYQETIKGHKKSDAYNQITNELKSLDEIKPRLQPVGRESIDDNKNLVEIDRLLETAIVDYSRLTDSIQSLSKDLLEIQNSKRWQIVCLVADALPRRRQIARLLRVDAVKRRAKQVKGKLARSSQKRD